MPALAPSTPRQDQSSQLFLRRRFRAELGSPIVQILQASAGVVDDDLIFLFQETVFKKLLLSGEAGGALRRNKKSFALGQQPSRNE